MASGRKKQITELIRLSLTLFLIAAIVAGSLAVANYFTAPIIAERADAQIDHSLESLFEEANYFEPIKTTVEKVTVSGESIPVKAVYAAKSLDNTTMGYCIRVTPNSYSDIIDMIVACDNADAVTGVRILSIADTPGVGLKVQSDPDFQKSVLGIDHTIEPVKSSPSSKQEIQVIAGATVSSKAYLNGVNAALEVAHGLE